MAHSLDGGITLVQAVAFAAAPMTLSGLVEASGLPRSRVADLVGRLERGGFVAREGEHYVPGWLLHGLAVDGQATVEHAELALDEDFMVFLSERLTEEVITAHQRCLAGEGLGPMTRAGLELLHEVMLDLERGALPDDVSLELLTAAYDSHPEFRPEWRRPSAMLGRGEVGTPRS